MPYLTPQELTAALTAAAVPGSPVPTDIQLAAAIVNSGSRMELAVRAGKFTVPVSSPSVPFRTAATSIALYNLLLDLRKAPRNLLNVEALYTSALKYLDTVATGKTDPAS